MPEANVLYGVTIVVVIGLAAWVVLVLRTAKEPWAREVPASTADDETSAPPSSADVTAESTPVIVAQKPAADEVEAESSETEASASEAEAEAETNAKAKDDAS